MPKHSTQENAANLWPEKVVLDNSVELAASGLIIYMSLLCPADALHPA